MSIKRFKYAKVVVDLKTTTKRFIRYTGEGYPEKGEIVKIVTNKNIKSPYWVSCKRANGDSLCLYYQDIVGVYSTKGLELQYNLTCL